MSNLEENRQAWIDALRSGEYKQTRKNLDDDQGYCFLGVSCKVYEDREHKILPRDFMDHIHGCNLTGYPEIRDYFGLINGRGENIDNSFSLVRLNDIEEYGFNQIADELETGDFWIENVQD